MELNTEINRIFGQEMAKVFAASISEEELQLKAREVWRNYESDTRNYNYYNHESQAQNLIKQALSVNLTKEVEKITSTEDFQNRMRSMAESIVEDVISETRRKMIDDISNRMAGLATGYCGLDLKGMIQQTIYEMMNH